MRQSVKNKTTTLKALAKVRDSNANAKSSNITVNDNLSKAIRTEKDAKVFRKDLSIAFNLVKK